MFEIVWWNYLFLNYVFNETVWFWYFSIIEMVGIGHDGVADSDQRVPLQCSAEGWRPVVPVADFGSATENLVNKPVSKPLI